MKAKSIRLGMAIAILVLDAKRRHYDKTNLKEEDMKTTLLAAVAALALGIAGTTEAQVPCGTGYGGWSNSTSYYYPTTSYGYGASQPYGVYSSYPQYGSTWNTPVYRAPSYSYDRVHGDYHMNNSRGFNGFGNSFPQYRNW